MVERRPGARLAPQRPALGDPQEILCQSRLRQAEGHCTIVVCMQARFGVGMGRQVKFSALCLLAGAFVSAGCGEQQRRPDLPQTVTLSSVTACEAVSAAEAVLRQMHFSIDKADPDAGVVRTFPLTAGQFFEFWRSIESYRKILPQFNKTLTTDMEYFKYLYNQFGD